MNAIILLADYHSGLDKLSQALPPACLKKPRRFTWWSKHLPTFVLNYAVSWAPGSRLLLDDCCASILSTKHRYNAKNGPRGTADNPTKMSTSPPDPNGSLIALMLAERDGSQEND